MILADAIKLLKAEIQEENVRGCFNTRKLSSGFQSIRGAWQQRQICRDFASKWAQTVKVEGRRGASSPPSERIVKSAVHKKDVVVSAWFVGAQQGEVVSEMVSSVAVSLWLV